MMTPVVSTIAVYRKQDGRLEYLAPASLAPPANDPLLASTPLPAGCREDSWSWSAASRTFVENAARVEAILLAEVKSEAEGRKMLVATPGGYKKTEYADKRAEVAAWEALGSSSSARLTAYNLLPLATREVRFGYAIADAAAFGDQPKDAIARFKTGMAAAGAAMRLAATEARACAVIRAATTPAAKRAAVAAISWPA